MKLKTRSSGYVCRYAEKGNTACSLMFHVEIFQRDMGLGKY